MLRKLLNLYQVTVELSKGSSTYIKIGEV